MKTPKLTRKIVRDDLALSDAICAVLSNSKGRRKVTKAILRLGKKLRRGVSPEAWWVYLQLEETVNDRESADQDVLVRWAFRQGRKRR